MEVEPVTAMSLAWLLKKYWPLRAIEVGGGEDGDREDSGEGRDGAGDDGPWLMKA